ncbi:hypothetical protein TNCV_851511 [Trichonephila clavipes]|nr:hypothetical protein TNCV_851511 [Trichonephila clavipes]
MTAPANSKFEERKKFCHWKEVEPPVHFQTDPFKLHGWVIFTPPQSPLIGGCNTFASCSLHCSPLVRGNNHPARLIPTTRRPHVHHLEAITCLVTFFFILTRRLYSPFKLYAFQMCEGKPTQKCSSLKLPFYRAL